jgi:hypothetical protein
MDLDNNGKHCHSFCSRPAVDDQKRHPTFSSFSPVEPINGRGLGPSHDGRPRGRQPAANDTPKQGSELAHLMLTFGTSMGRQDDSSMTQRWNWLDSSFPPLQAH